jgi:hypothetical protein
MGSTRMAARPLLESVGRDETREVVVAMSL